MTGLCTAENVPNIFIASNTKNCEESLYRRQLSSLPSLRVGEGRGKGQDRVGFGQIHVRSILENLQLKLPVLRMEESSSLIYDGKEFSRLQTCWTFSKSEIEC